MMIIHEHYLYLYHTGACYLRACRRMEAQTSAHPFDSDRQSMSPIVVESTLVTLRHPEKDITVPETILRACSPVLDGILRDAAEPEEGGNKIITIDDVSLEVLEAFVGMVTMSSYAPTDISLTNDDLATSAELLMPLIHKYDCKGLLIGLQDAVNATPEVPSIFVMLQTQYGMDSRWMSKKALHCLARYLFGVDYYKNPAWRAQTTKDLDELPASVLAYILTYVFSNAKIKDRGGDHNVYGPKYIDEP